MNDAILWLLVPLVFLVAAAYAAVGLGGGSGYLAVMTLAGLPALKMTPTALLLNLVVTGAALLRFGMAGRLRWRLLLPFLLPALPAAFAGAWISADRRIFLTILALTLTGAACSMLFHTPSNGLSATCPSSTRLLLTAIPAGLAIGFLSGFLGIGGGVFLGPLILLLGWAGPRETAALNSAIVLSLSAAGLTAHGLRGNLEATFTLPLAAAALLGGLAGATLTERALSPRAFRRWFAVILLAAALKAGMDAFLG